VVVSAKEEGLDEKFSPVVRPSRKTLQMRLGQTDLVQMHQVM
jgi:hypothetical protein